MLMLMILLLTLFLMVEGTYINRRKHRIRNSNPYYQYPDGFPSDDANDENSPIKNTTSQRESRIPYGPNGRPKRTESFVSMTEKLQKQVEQMLINDAKPEETQDKVTQENFGQETGVRNLAFTYTIPNCTTQTSDYVCSECNATLNSYLFLRDGSQILCAYLDTSASEVYYDYDYSDCETDSDGYYTDDCVPVETTYTVSVCRADQASYPDTYTLYEDFEYYYYENIYAYNLSISTGYVMLCFNEYLYFTGSTIDDIKCDLDSGTADTTDIALNAVLISTAIQCPACTIDGYETGVVKYFSQFEIYTTECSSDTYGCDFTEYYDTSSQQCISCNDLVKNCAACSSTTCTLCLENFYLHNSVYDYATGTYKSQCVYDTCPTGYCKSLSTLKCVAATDTNCINCYQGTDASQFCMQCKVGYNYDYDTDNCTQIPTTTLNIAYYVSSGITYTSAANSLTIEDGSTPTLAMPFIMHAVNSIFAIDSDYSSINATIYLGKGSHFLFVCQGTETTMYNKLTDLATFCSNTDLKLTRQNNQNTDDITIYLLPLECSLGTSLGVSSDTNFATMCVDLTKDSKPTVYVNTALAYFNITGKMVVKNIIFSGINAQAKPTTSIYDFTVYPIQLCKVTSEPTGQEGTLKMTKITSSTFTAKHKCVDVAYVGSTIPTSGSMSQACGMNNYKQFLKTKKSTLSCGGVPTSSDFFSFSTKVNEYNKRRKTLFNLYMFADHNTIKNSPPELIIEDCEFEYFFNGFESLINVETNSFSSTQSENHVYCSDCYEMPTEKRTYYLYNQGDRGAKINISDSSFSNSRFCKGMIVYRKAPADFDSRGLTNFTHLYMTNFTRKDEDAYVILKNCEFDRLNIFRNVSSLAISGYSLAALELSSNSIEPVSIPPFIHKGIVLNLEDFGGRVEIVECTFTKNMHFIPSIYYRNHNYSSDMTVDNFKDMQTTLEYQMQICDQTTYTDKYFFGNCLSHTDDIDGYFDQFERLGTIYISRNQGPIVIANNLFTKNIGTFGGAITINSPNWQAGRSPYVIIVNNEFMYNMAYFSGNAIYIRNTILETQLTYACAGVHIQNNYFGGNIGFKFHNGGAISAYCLMVDNALHADYKSTSGYSTSGAKSDVLVGTITTYANGAKIYYQKYKFNIEDNDFLENYSGQKGTAIYARQISNLRINNCTFAANGPVYVQVEYMNSPYVKYFSKHSITFYHPDCFDELEYLGWCYTEENTYIDYSRVQGVVYVEACQSQQCNNPNYTKKLEISDSGFVKNLAGPIIEPDFENTMYPTSQVHIVGGFQNLISNVNFLQNKGTYLTFGSMKTSNISKYWPTNYFESSQVPLITVLIEPENPKYFVTMNTTIYLCTFSRNQNVQVIGLNEDISKYQGSLIRVVNNADTALMYLPIVSIKESTFQDNIFIGDDSVLIYVKNALLQVHKSTFLNNGYLSYNWVSNSPSKVKIYATRFDYYAYTFEQKQKYGLFYVNGEYKLPNYTHQFINNTYSMIFSEFATAYYLDIVDQDVYTYGNTYKYLFASSAGPVIYGTSSDGRSTIYMENELISHVYTNDTGMISISCAYPDFINLILTKVSFTNVQAEKGSALYLENTAKVVLNNVNATRNAYYNDTAVWLRNQFKLTYFSFSTFVDFTSFSKLINKIVPTRGYLMFNQIENTLPVTLGTKTLYSSSYKYLGYVEITDCSFTNMVTNQSSVIEAQNTKIRMINSNTNKKLYLSNNTHYENGVIGLFYESVFLGENLLIVNNTATSKSSALYVSASTVQLQNTYFGNNNAYEVGTILVESNSNFICSYCTLYNNSAENTATVFGYNNEEAYVTFYNSQFLSNKAGVNLINLMFTNALFVNTTFINNIAREINHGFTVINSVVVMTNINVDYTNQTFLTTDSTVDTGFIKLDYSSTLTISGSTIKNTRAAKAAVLYATGNSNAFINGNTLIQQCHSPSGNVIYGTLASGIFINQTRFVNNSQIDVYLDKTYGLITNSSFRYTGQQSIYILETSVDIIRNLFYDGFNQLIQGKAIYCNCIDLNVSNNTFRNLTAVQGGAIFLTSNLITSNFTLAYNQFIENNAMHGGALYFQDSAYTDIIGNYFRKNNAAVITPSNAVSVSLKQKALGGAILYACQNDEIKKYGDCILNLKSYNQFEINYSENDGGAIQWLNTMFNDDGTTKYTSNSAYYANNVGSYPDVIFVEWVSNGDYYDNYTQNASALVQDEDYLRSRRLQEISTVPNIVSGTQFAFNVYILDKAGQIYKSDSESKAKFEYTGSSRVSLQNNEIVANDGVYYFTNIDMVSVPGADYSFALNLKNVETYGNTIGFLDVPVSFDVSARNCVSGEQYTGDYRCEVCPENKYLIGAKESEAPCQPCPDNAICYGLDVMAPMEGYWRSSNISELITECENSDACLGGDEEHQTGECLLGYVGIICGDCDANYEKSADFECKECPPRIRNIIQISLLLTLMVFYTAYLVKGVLGSGLDEITLDGVYMKILTNHFQLLGCISVIDFNWPSLLTEVQSGTDKVSQVTQSIYSFDCMMYDDQGRDDPDFPIFYRKLVMYALLPILLAIISLLFWLIYLKCRKRGYGELKTKFLSTIIVCCYIVHPNICESVFTSFNCIDIEGTYRLSNNVATVCYEGIHMKYLAMVSIPSLFIWVLGIPFYAFLFLYYNRDSLILMDKKKLTEEEEKKIICVKQRYGFLLGGYKGKYYYWETIIFYRSLFIVLAGVFLSRFSAEVQVLAVFFIAIVSLLIQLIVTPFFHPILNKMEAFSLQVCIITLYAGLFFVTGTHYEYMNGLPVTIIFILIVLIPNGIFFLWWGKYKLIEVLKEVYEKTKRWPKLFRYFACMTRRQFYYKYMKEHEEVHECDTCKEKREKKESKKDDSSSSSSSKDSKRKDKYKVEESPNISRKNDEEIEEELDNDDVNNHADDEGPVRPDDVKLNFSHNKVRKRNNRKSMHSDTSSQSPNARKQKNPKVFPETYDGVDTMRNIFSNENEDNINNNNQPDYDINPKNDQYWNNTFKDRQRKRPKIGGDLAKKSKDVNKTYSHSPSPLNNPKKKYQNNENSINDISFNEEKQQ